MEDLLQRAESALLYVEAVPVIISELKPQAQKVVQACIVVTRALYSVNPLRSIL